MLKKEKAKRRLKNMEIDELSLVGAPANKQSFLLLKQEGKTKVEIETDGTKDGTIVKVNGESFDDMCSFYISMYESDDNINCSFTRKVEAEDGFKRIESYTLSKGGLVMDEIKTILKAMFGDEYKIEKHDKPEEAYAALQKSLEVVKEYTKDMPEDLAKAVQTLVNVGVNGIEAKKEVTAESTETQENKNNKEKSEKENTNEEIGKSIKEISASIAEVVKSNKETSETLKGLADRLEKVEEQAENSKLIKGQDDGTGKGSTDLFPSIAI